MSPLTCEKDRYNTNLGGKIIRRSTQRPHRGVTVFRKPKVCNLDVPVKVQQDILRFQVTVDDVESMKIVQGQRNLCGIEFRYWVRESLKPRSIRVSNIKKRAIKNRIPRPTFDLRKSVNNSPPGTKSMTIYRLAESWKVPQRLMMNGCCTACNIICSFRVCETCFIRTIFSLDSTLIA